MIRMGMYAHISLTKNLLPYKMLIWLNNYYIEGIYMLSYPVRRRTK